MINANRIEFIMQDLMYREDEMVEGKPSVEPVVVDAIRTTFGLHPDRLAMHKPEIESFLVDLNEDFSKGLSFLQLFYTRSGEQWAATHDMPRSSWYLGSRSNAYRIALHSICGQRFRADSLTS